MSLFERFYGCVRTENTGSNKTCWALLARHPSLLGYQYHGLESLQSVAKRLTVLGRGNLLLHGDPGNLTEGLTVFALKDGNVMRRVGIGVGHRSLAAPDAASSINSLYIGPLMPA